MAGVTDVDRERAPAYAALSTYCKVPPALTPAEVEACDADDEDALGSELDGGLETETPGCAAGRGSMA
jgi:hypothetical protein